MSARNSALVAETAAFLSSSVTDVSHPSDDDADSWLGCESLHPLTWLPADAAPRALGASVASAD